MKAIKKILLAITVDFIPLSSLINKIGAHCDLESSSVEVKEFTPVNSELYFKALVEF